MQQERHLCEGAGRDYYDALGRRPATWALPQQRPDERDHLQRLSAPQRVTLVVRYQICSPDLPAA